MSLLSFLSTLANGAFDGQGQMDPDDPRFPASPVNYNPNGPALQAPQVPQPPLSPSDMAPPVDNDPTQPSSPQDVMVMGDRWKPKKGTILGAIADAIASYTGDGTPFSDERDKQNMVDASKTLADNPMLAISRIAKIDPDKAFSLLDKYRDNMRQQGNLDRQNKLYDLSVEKMVDSKVGGLLYSAAQSGNPALIAKAREMAIRLGKTYGIDYSERLPADSAGLEDFALTAMGYIPAAKQMQTNTTIRGQDLSHQDRQEGHQVARERNAVLANQGDRRIDVSQQNADTGKMNADTSRKSEEKRPDKGQTTNVISQYGPGRISGDGKSLTVISDADRGEYHRGEQIHFIKLGNKWVPTPKKYTPPKN